MKDNTHQCASTTSIACGLLGGAGGAAELGESVRGSRQEGGRWRVEAGGRAASGAGPLVADREGSTHGRDSRQGPSDAARRGRGGRDAGRTKDRSENGTGARDGWEI